MVKICYWDQKQLFLVHIRDFKEGYNGFHIPDVKGIALTIDTWRNLYENIEHINEDVEELSKKY